MAIYKVKDLSAKSGVPYNVVYEFVGEGKLPHEGNGRHFVWSDSTVDTAVERAKELYAARKQEERAARTSRMEQAASAQRAATKGFPLIRREREEQDAGSTRPLLPAGTTRMLEELGDVMRDVETAVVKNQALQHGDTVAVLAALSSLTEELRGLRKDMNDAFEAFIEAKKEGV